jgi:putative transposase
MTMLHSDEENTHSRRNSLRLSGFDYSAKRVYFVTIVVLDRRPLFRNDALAKATVDCLLTLREKVRFNLYCYCLMPDHFHALIGAGESGKSLGEICGAFKSLSTRVHWRWYQGRLWQRQFFDHIIRNEKDFVETMEYIKQNPIRRGLVSLASEWPYTGTVDEYV